MKPDKNETVGPDLSPGANQKDIDAGNQMGPGRDKEKITNTDNKVTNADNQVLNKEKQKTEKPDKEQKIEKPEEEKDLTPGEKKKIRKQIHTSRPNDKA